MIDPDFLALLRCPLHPEGPPFKLQGDLLVCQVEGHAFPIVDGIPHLLPEDAIPAEQIAERGKSEGE